jgi:septum site-determining protein MinD
LAASQTKDKTVLTEEGVGRVLNQLKDQFDYIVCDSPAGIESGACCSCWRFVKILRVQLDAWVLGATGARHAMYFADKAVIVTNPELSSCRDSDKMIGFIASKSKRAEEGKQPVQQVLLVTRFGEEEEQQRFVFLVATALSNANVCIFVQLPRSRARKPKRVLEPGGH